MYCQKCGEEMRRDARFCPSCGTPAEMPAQVNNSDPVLVLNSVFVPSVVISTLIPFWLFFTVWGGLFFGGFFGMALSTVFGVSAAYSFVFFGCLFFFIPPVLAYVFIKKNYEKTEYRFYNDRLEYYEGFLAVEEKTIRLKNVTEVYLRRGIFQKKNGLGTIVLSTPATMTSSRGRAGSGIMVADIKHPSDAYHKIKSLVAQFA